MFYLLGFSILFSKNQNFFLFFFCSKNWEEFKAFYEQIRELTDLLQTLTSFKNSFRSIADQLTANSNTKDNQDSANAAENLTEEDKMGFLSKLPSGVELVPKIPENKRVEFSVRFENLVSLS